MGGSIVYIHTTYKHIKITLKNNVIKTFHIHWTMFLHTFLVSQNLTASNLAPRGYLMSLWLSSLPCYFPCDVVGSILANTCITYHVIATGNLNNRDYCTIITLWSFSNNDINVTVIHLKTITVLETLVVNYTIATWVYSC